MEMIKEWLEPFRKMRACEEALVWADGYASLDEAWAKCERGDWMLWLLGKLSGEPDSASRKKLVLVACQCARLALPYVEPGDGKPLKTIETAEAWAKGESKVTLEDVRIATNAYDAAYVNAADPATAAEQVLAQCADLVRQHYPQPPEKKETP